MSKTVWPSTLVAVAFLAFIFGVLWLGLDHGSNFSTIWAALGSIVGVVTGAIPSYFFKQQADRASGKTAVYAAHVPAEAAHAVNTKLQELNLL